MTHLLIVLAVTCGAGVDILAESQPDGRLTKRACCQERSDATVRAVPTADPSAAVKPCCAKQAATGNTAAAPVAMTAGLLHPTIRPPADDTQERINTSCPVCDLRIADDSKTVYHNGFQVGVCPGICHATFRKTSAVEKDTFIARLAKPISSRCAVTGCRCPIGSHPATFNGSVVSLCCDTCRNYWYASDHATRAGWVRKNVHGIAAAQPAGSTIAAMTTPNTTFMEVNGMTCQACVDKVAAALKSIQGVKTVQIELDKNLVRVETETAKAIPAGELAKVVETAGFSAKILEAAAARSIMNPADAGGSGESIPLGEGKPTCSGAMQARMVLLEVGGVASEADARAVKDALGAMKGVFRTTVDRETKLVDILVDLSGSVDAERAAKYLSLAGYDAKEASDEQYDAETERLRNGGAIVQYADPDEIEKR